MTIELRSHFAFDNSFARELAGLYEPWQAATAPDPQLLVLNKKLATQFGIDPISLELATGIQLLVGNAVPTDATPIAQAYAGHQFGGFSPRLGDGRALLLGEVHDIDGNRHDIHLKGSGRTPFARGGDGKAAVGPMLREYVISEALHALGIPTTRSLAVVATGESIQREGTVPGAVLTRVAASHVRVGSFQYAANHEDATLLSRLANYAINRHYPHAFETDNPYLAFLEFVVDAQASLVAQWMLVGFIHGVMNTDNVTVSGESIDFGPCAFMDTYDPETVFSSIDHAGRYAYGHQPTITQWNLARFAETLLPLIDGNTDQAIEVATNLLTSFPDRYQTHWEAGMHSKLGLASGKLNDSALVNDFLVLLQVQRVDYTASFRALSSLLRDDASLSRELFDNYTAFETWVQRWQLHLPTGNSQLTADAMDQVNPLYIARNHLVEEALVAATHGNLELFERLLNAITRPFTERNGMDTFARPAPASFGHYRTFCGT